jgi:hypothetical protein
MEVAFLGILLEPWWDCNEGYMMTCSSLIFPHRWLPILAVPADGYANKIKLG